MAVQTSVALDLTSGIVGELAFDTPKYVITATLNSGAGAANNIVGRAFCYDSTANELVSAGGDAGNFAGILIKPKQYPLRGTAADTLATSLLLPDGQVVELLQEGEIYVSLASDGGDIGDPIFYTDATGALDHGTADVGETQIPNCHIVRHVPSPTAAGVYLAVIRLTA
jgi:hypothetical protein